MAKQRKRRRGWGAIRQLPSRRYQAHYVGPDLTKHTAPTTFETSIDAEGWLAAERRLIEAGTWRPPRERDLTLKSITLADYSATWLADRTVKPRTRQHYRSLLDHQILPTLGERQVRLLTPIVMRQWHAQLGAKTPTLRAHAYGLLRTILGSAVDDGLLSQNPCHIRGASSSRRVHKIKPATPHEIATIADAMPERLRLMVLLAAWCGLRFGELAELRRGDIDAKNGRIKIRRAVVRAGGAPIVGTPKSSAGIRDVSVPPHLLPAVKDHLANHAQWGRDGLLFPAVAGGHLAPSTLYGSFYKARSAAGRDDLRWHDLRHTGATLAAGTGASLAELMARLGHSTQGAALVYQHAVSDRDLEIARRLSEMVRE